MKVYQEIASRVNAIRNCEKSGNEEWRIRHNDALDKIERNILPSGAGIDSGTKIDREKSTDEKIVLSTAYHHMDEHGGYDDWTEHDVIVTASLWNELNLRITGRNRNDIKDYLHEVFHDSLTRPMPPDPSFYGNED